VATLRRATEAEQLVYEAIIVTLTAPEERLRRVEGWAREHGGARSHALLEAQQLAESKLDRESEYFPITSAAVFLADVIARARELSAS